MAERGSLTPAFDDIDARWSRRWREAGVYERDPEPGREKFLATYPYSYMNSYPHVGHAYTMLRADLRARYERMRGKNALFPFAYHVTGTPIVAAANRIAEGEPTQIKILRDQGIAEEDIPAFADPEHWVRFFPREWRQDVERLGLGIDWRRAFHTTELNPAYDAFIRWQFRKLREKGLVAKGSHPVIWCPKDDAPVADHDRVEGEGETPQEWTLIKLRLRDAEGVLPEGEPAYLVAATLRPDTMFGQTNVWVDAEAPYAVARVAGERWILGREAARKLGYQKPEAELVPDLDIPGSTLVGCLVRAPARDADVPVLPARFIRQDRGTGIVTSVPSDAPYDLVALQDLVQDRVDYPGLDADGLARARELARDVAPIPIIATERFGDVAAEAVLEDADVRDQLHREVLDEATDAVYKAGFYDGTLLDACGPFAGQAVDEAKDAMRGWLRDTGGADVFYEPTGPVVCRCLTPAIVKLVRDQWFLRYGDPEWKARTHEALDGMAILPEVARKQFHYVVDWLNDWACTRQTGLGTRIPWDDEWLIESLSDSTIYMAYYTLAPWLEGDAVDPADLTDALFDHVLLGVGEPQDAAKGTVTPEIVRELRESFRYWYPVDLRNSGKDLLQNHLTFFVFNHVAIWEDQPENWPQGMSVNGWVMVDGDKMSKSRGNFITLREALDAYGTTATRLALAYAGEGLDDANFDREFAASIPRRVQGLLDLARDPPATRSEPRHVDAWFRSTLHRLVAEATEAMESMTFRTALKVGVFDLQREWAWYLRRTGGEPHADLLAMYLDVQIRILTPFAPHLAEELHAQGGGEGFAIDAPWPDVDEDALNPAAEATEAYVRRVLDDAKEILQVTGIAPTRVLLYTAPAWKRRLQAHAVALAREDRLDMGPLMGRAMDDPEVQAHAREAPKAAQALVGALRNASDAQLREREADLAEHDVLSENARFLAQELDAPVEVHDAGGDDVPDPGDKARMAEPGRPAIYVE